MYIWIHDKYSSDSFKQRPWQRQLHWYDKFNFSHHVCHCGAVVKELLARADNRVRLPATLFSVSLYRSFFFVPVWSLFWTLFFLLAFFFLILDADPAGHALGSIYVLSLSPEFYFGKRISKALGLHTGQAYDQIKTISCQDMSLHWNSWIFFQC